MQLVYLLPLIAFAAGALELHPGGALVPEEPAAVVEAREWWRPAGKRLPTSPSSWKNWRTLRGSVAAAATTTTTAATTTTTTITATTVTTTTAEDAVAAAVVAKDRGNSADTCERKPQFHSLIRTRISPAPTVRSTAEKFYLYSTIQSITSNKEVFV
jgi:hypothetical protein